MNGDRKVLTKAVARALSGKGAHVEPGSIFVGLDWRIAGTRREHVAHSLFQLLNHMVFCQDWVMSWLDREKPPSTSTSWRRADGPATREEWEQAVRRFRSGLNELARRSREADPLSKRGKTTRLEMLQTVASHNSYHAGQVVLLRRMLNASSERITFWYIGVGAVSASRLSSSATRVFASWPHDGIDSPCQKRNQRETQTRPLYTSLQTQELDGV